MFQCFYLQVTSNRPFDLVLSVKIRICPILWILDTDLSQETVRKTHSYNWAVHKICSCGRDWRLTGTLQSGSPQPWVEELSCLPLLPGRAVVAAYGLLFCHPWGISVRTRGVLRSWITCSGGLASPPAPFFGFAGFPIKVMSAELIKQWFVATMACRARAEAFCKTLTFFKIMYFCFRRSLNFWPIRLIVEIGIVLMLPVP